MYPSCSTVHTFTFYTLNSNLGSGHNTYGSCYNREIKQQSTKCSGCMAGSPGIIKHWIGSWFALHSRKSSLFVCALCRQNSCAPNASQIWLKQQFINGDLLHSCSRHRNRSRLPCVYAPSHRFLKCCNVRCRASAEIIRSIAVNTQTKLVICMKISISGSLSCTRSLD